MSPRNFEWAEDLAEPHLRRNKFASLGWASLMVNYRGSSGYGQAFTDAVFADQNGNEAQDVCTA